MPNNNSDFNAVVSISQLVANINTEVFMKSEDDRNVPITQTQHASDNVAVADSAKAHLVASNIAYVWGFSDGAFSDESGESPQGLRWSHTGAYG